MIPSIGDLVKIACGILNKYKCALARQLENEEMAQKMLDRSTLENHVKTFVEENNLARRRSVYTPLNAVDNLDDFPKLSYDSVRDITLGVYQLKQAPSYTKQHLSDSGSYDFLLCKEYPTLIQVKIQSRHSKALIHMLWIQYSTDEACNQPITGWYCTCKVGARMVGCCAHVASVLWYLGLERHNKSIKPSRLSVTTSVLNASAAKPEDLTPVTSASTEE